MNEILKLEISVKGEATSNIVLYQKSVLSQLEQIKSKKLVTDEDFSTAEKVVKICKEQEQALVDAKQSAQDESASIKDVFAAIDNAQNIFRNTRLGLERQIKAEKQNRKSAIINGAVNDFFNHGKGLLERYGFEDIPYSFDPETEFTNATKGKKSLEKMQESVDLVLARTKDVVSSTASGKFSNLQIIKGRVDQFLFSDSEALSDLAPDLLMTEINKRELAEKDRKERIEREKEEQLKKEEEARIFAEKTKEAANDLLGGSDIPKDEPSFHPSNVGAGFPETHNEQFSVDRPTFKQGQTASDNNSYFDDREQEPFLPDNQKGFSPPPETSPQIKKGEAIVKKFHIEIKGSYDFEATQEMAVRVAQTLKQNLSQQFGDNCVSLAPFK